MKWFTGTIPEAIGQAKLTDAIFVVYVHDTSEASVSTDETLADETLASVLSSKKFVAIKLENGTESAKQFAQIYPVVVLPSLYFISGSTGIPLEILGGPLTKEKLKEKLDQFTKDAKDEESEETSNSAPIQSSSSSEEKMEVEESQASAATAAAPAEDRSSGSGAQADIPHDPENETIESIMAEEAKVPGNSEIPFEERVARAKILLAEKQAKKAEEKAEEERRKEKERRKMGQEIAKRKRQMYEDEVQSVVRERKKEKEEDRLARERVKAQIAADRLERERRAAMLQGEAPAPTQEPAACEIPPAAASSNRNATITRLKFRMPDGSSSVAQFPVEATLSEIRQHVQQQLVSSSSFMLTSTVHHKPFTSEDNDRSLLDLGLVPSAIIVVLMNTRPSGGGAVVSSGGGIMQYIWLLLSPITFLLTFVRELFSVSPPPRPSSSSDSSASRPSTSQTTQQRPTSSYGRPTERRWQRDGNIHRLQGSDDEDDNNTWNGNSTQQM